MAFSAAQYARERDLAEKYAFKAASSAAIRNHIEFLLQTFKKEEIFEFANDTFYKIYKEPYKNDDVDKKKLKEMEEKIKELEAQNNKKESVNIQTVIESTKELQNLFEDETLLKKVLDFFTKLFSR